MISLAKVISFHAEIPASVFCPVQNVNNLNNPFYTKLPWIPKNLHTENYYRSAFFLSYFFFFSWNYKVIKLHEVDKVPCAILCKISNIVCSLIYVIGVLNVQQLLDFLHLIATERQLGRVKDFASTNYETFTGMWRYTIINTDYKTFKSGFE